MVFSVLKRNGVSASAKEQNVARWPMQDYPPCQNTRVLYKYATLFPSISSQSQLCQRKVLFFLIYFFQCNPHTHTMEVTVIFSSNHRAVSDGTCVLNKTGRRTDVMLSGLCFSFFFLFLSILLPLFLFSPSVGCYMGYFCFV